jgi:hypothetical protein
MRRKIAVIVLIDVRLHMSLKDSDDINVFRIFHRTKERAALLAIVVVKANLSLKSEVEEMGIAEVKNIQVVLPKWSHHVERWVKSWNCEGHYLPQESIAIPVVGPRC